MHLWPPHLPVHTLVEQNAPQFEGEAHRPTDPKVVHVFNFLKTLLVIVLLQLIIVTNSWFTALLLLLVVSFLLVWSQVMVSEGVGIFSGLVRARQLCARNFGPMFGLTFSLMLCGLLFFSILDSGFLLFGNNLLYMLLDYLSMNFLLDGEQAANFFSIALVFFTMFVLLLVFALLVTGSGLQYFSNLEVNEANFLRDKIQQIQVRREIRGLERE